MSKIFPSLSQLINLFTGGPVMQMKVIEIGDWDMNADGVINVAHGFTGDDWKKIRSINVVIRNDADDTYYQSPGAVDGTGLSAEMGVDTLKTTNIRVGREVSSIFDAVGFETPPGGNRGWVTIWHEA